MTLKDVGMGLARRVVRGARWRHVQRRLQGGHPLRPGPSWVQIGLDDRCNYRCIMCRTHSYLLPREPELHFLPYDVVTRLLRELRALGTQHMDVCGFGEPLLHPQIMPILSLMKELGFETQLITNGGPLTREICGALLAMGLDRLRVSINSGLGETHEQITQAPAGERAQIMELLGYLVQQRDAAGGAKPEVGVTIAIQRDNCREILALGEEVARLKIDNLEFLPLGINDASKELIITEEEQAEVVRQVKAADARVRTAGRTTTMEHFLTRPTATDWTREFFRHTPCYVGQFFCRINANGDVNPCCPSTRVLGNVLEHSFSEVWNGPAWREFRREALALPGMDRTVRECSCWNCYHSPAISDFHARLQRERGNILFSPW
jgi:MoaA/NifB/PqqE/SkfB family radical SAM enzyme